MAVVFSGSFRPWHGVPVLEAAARMLRRRGDIFFILAGGHRRGEPSGYHGRLLGALPYERMPAVLAAGDVGVAPYDTARLRQMRLGFYWSPLKVFEYMASGLPVVTIDRPPLDDIVRRDREGLHVREADPADLCRALEELAADAPARERMGRAARERVVDRYSWGRHCQQLEEVLRRIAS
jgi:glycosyltransferase involved in cell wall biosynthesis